MGEVTQRLIIVDTEMGRIVGGAQTCLLRLVPELARRGWFPAVVCEPPEPTFASELRAAGADVFTAPVKYPRIVEDSARRLAQWVNGQRPLAYVLSVSSGSGWAAMPLLDEAIPTLAVVHSDDQTFYGPVRHYLSVTDQVVAVSGPIYSYLLDTVGMDASHVCHAPYGVDKRTPRRPEGRPLRVAFVGRLSEEDKQISVLAEAIVRLRDVPIDFVVAGVGPDVDFFRTLLGKQHRAELLGQVSPAVAVATIAASDCLVLTSTGREGMPLSVLEARACGVVPVLSDIPAHSALVEHGIDGVLVRPGDPGALAAALRSLVGDAHQLQAMSERSYLRADDSTVGAMTDAYEEAISRASRVRRSRGGRPAVPLMQSCVSRWPASIRKVRASATSFLHPVGGGRP